MATEKQHNHFLDVSDSDQGHSDGRDSENELTRGHSGLKKKKRRQAIDAKATSATDATDASEPEDDSDGSDSGRAADRRDVPDAATPGKDGEAARPKRQLKLSVPNPLAHKNLITTEEGIKRSGVIYLSRVPPYARPSKIRSLLSPHGPINRIFLSPESQLSHSRRRRAGGNKRRNFTEGWVEFVRKRDAKRAVELLNARPIGGPKGSYYYDTVWSMVYLHGFKWRDLTGQIAAEEAERGARLRAEMGRAAKGDKEFVRNLERSKEIGGMERKRKAKEERAGGADEDEGNGGNEGNETERAREREQSRARRTFAQVPLAKKVRVNEDLLPVAVNRVLGKIF